MHKLYELKETLCKELEEYSKADQLDVASLDIIDKLAHTIKNIDKILGAEEYDGYSGYNGGYSNARGYSGRQYSMNDGYSYARGRGGNARRDSMGRYSNADMSGELRRLMDAAPDDQTRAELSRMAQRYE